jgi:hypothetical protein
VTFSRRAFLGGGMLLASTYAIPRWLWWALGRPPEPTGELVTGHFPAAWYDVDSVAVQIERVRERLPKLFERDDAFYRLMIEKLGNAEDVSSRAMRLPLVLNAPRVPPRARRWRWNRKRYFSQAA